MCNALYLIFSISVQMQKWTNLPTHQSQSQLQAGGNQQIQPKPSGWYVAGPPSPGSGTDLPASRTCQRQEGIQGTTVSVTTHRGVVTVLAKLNRALTKSKRTSNIPQKTSTICPYGCNDFLSEDEEFTYSRHTGSGSTSQYTCTTHSNR